MIGYVCFIKFLLVLKNLIKKKMKKKKGIKYELNVF